MKPAVLGRTRKPGRPPRAHQGEARDALLTAAQSIMTEKGMPKLTLREVAARAGVQPALVNYYFGGKAGLLRAVVIAVAEQMRDRVEQALACEEDPEQRVRAFVRGLIEALTAAPYAPRLMAEQVLFADSSAIEEFAERFARPNLAPLLALLEDGRAKRRLRAVEPRFAIPAIVGACVYFFLSADLVDRLHEIDARDEALTREFAEHTAELILFGLATRTGAPL